ncbi:MAG TPA: hypothetical protein VHE30_26150 [Polyangiaceae bacterium]|nr:hypothetical protein [Polyangiaceae bacterium]
MLGATPARIAEALAEGLGREETRRARIRLEDVSFAAPLDLHAEPPPPGIPGEVLVPRTWGRAFWLAPSGSGRSLAGAYLEARGLASWVPARTFAEARDRLPAKGPVFVELWGHESVDTTDLDREGICIAGPTAPEDGRYAVVRSPPPRSFVAALVRWLAARLPSDGRFDPERARALLERECESGVVDGLGSALGLAGLVDRFGPDELATRGVANAAERLVSERLARAARESGTEPTWIAKHGMEVLVRLAHGALASEEAWDAPRSFESYVASVPPEWKDRIDVEWLKASLERAAAPRTVREVERALRETSPGAFRVVRSLERARLLRKEGAGHELSVAPRVVARIAHERAKTAVISGSPEGWGEVLLGRSPEFLVRGVLARVEGGDDDILTEALDLPESESAESIAATELAFRVAGLGRLGGADVSDGVLSALWERQNRLMIGLDDGPHPRIPYPDSVAKDEPLLRIGTFRLAALSVAEALAGHAPEARPPLPRREERHRLFDSILEALPGVDVRGTRWALAAFELAGRSRQDEAELPRAVHPLEWPTVVLDALEAGRLEWRQLAASVTAPGMTALLSLGDRRGVTLQRLAGAAFECFDRAPYAIAAGSFLSPEWAESAAILAASPAPLVSKAIRCDRLDASRLPYEALPPGLFRELVVNAGARVLRVPAALRTIPLDVVPLALAGGPLPPEAVRALHDRAPDLVIGAIVDAIGGGEVERATLLLSNLPESATEALVEKLDDLRLLAKESLPRRLVTRFLHERVARRSPGFREALGLLGRLESPD